MVYTKTIMVSMRTDLWMSICTFVHPFNYASDDLIKRWEILMQLILHKFDSLLLVEKLSYLKIFDKI